MQQEKAPTTEEKLECINAFKSIYNDENQAAIADFIKLIKYLNYSWWHDLKTGEPLNRLTGDLKMLCVSELGEAAEGVRKSLQDDHLPQHPMEQVEIADFIIRLLDAAAFKKFRHGGLNYNTFSQIVNCNASIGAASRFPTSKLSGLFEVSIRVRSKTLFEPLAFALIYCKVHGFIDRIEQIILEKLEYNVMRADHSVSERLKEGGKKH